MRLLLRVNSCGVFQYDRAIIDFGNVTNNFAAQDAESHSSIVITWDAVMIQNDDTVHQTDYWVSAGAEYNYENEVWVGQASLTALTDAEVGHAHRGLGGRGRLGVVSLLFPVNELVSLL